MKISVTHDEALRLFSKALGVTVTSYELETVHLGKVVMTYPEGNRITAIKELRCMVAGLQLADAKEKVEKAMNRRIVVTDEWLSEAGCAEVIKRANPQFREWCSFWPQERFVTENLMA